MLEEELNSDDSDDDSDSDYDEYDDEDDEFESYETLLDAEDAEDEYIIFRQTMEHLQGSDQEVYNLLSSNLNKEQISVIEEVYTFAKQRKDAKGWFLVVK